LMEDAFARKWTQSVGDLMEKKMLLEKRG
jgi:hypothetical protein